MVNFLIQGKPDKWKTWSKETIKKRYYVFVSRNCEVQICFNHMAKPRYMEYTGIIIR